MSGRAPAPIPPDPTLVALRGSVVPRPYDSRAIVRATFNPECQILPAAAAMAVSIDTLAEHAHAAGLGPEPRRAMGQLARAQGETFDANMLTTGAPLLDAFVAGGWLEGPNIAVVNVGDHVPPPTAAGLTGSGGKPGEAAWRHYHVRRVAYTMRAVAVAMTQPTPTLLLRGVVETTGFAGTPVRCFGEFDFALIFPPAQRPPRGEVRAALIQAAPGGTAGDDHGGTGLVVVGDAKSWRRLGRLDNGDKRAAAALQIGLYVAAARATWPAGPAGAVCAHGLVVNPPGTGGLSVATLTQVDLSDALRAIAQIPARAARAVPTVSAALARAVRAGAALGHADPAVTGRAIEALLEHGSWKPACLTRCPNGQACRRHAQCGGSVERLGEVAVQAGDVASITRLNALRAGAAPTADEAEIAAALRAADELLGADIALPWVRPGVGPERPGGAGLAVGA
jgi:hypothetical protein